MLRVQRSQSLTQFYVSWIVETTGAKVKESRENEHISDEMHTTKKHSNTKSGPALTCCSHKERRGETIIPSERAREASCADLTMPNRINSSYLLPVRAGEFICFYLGAGCLAPGCARPGCTCQILAGIYFYPCSKFSFVFSI